MMLWKSVGPHTLLMVCTYMYPNLPNSRELYSSHPCVIASTTSHKHCPQINAMACI